MKLGTFRIININRIKNVILSTKIKIIKLFTNIKNN